MVALIAEELVAISTDVYMLIAARHLAGRAKRKSSTSAEIAWELLFTPLF